MPDVEKTLLVNLLVNADDSVKSVNAFQARINASKQAMKTLMDQGLTLSQAFNKLSNNISKVGGKLGDNERATEALKQAYARLGSEMTNAGGKTNNLGQSMSKTGRIIERIFAAAIIGIALNAMRRLINAFKEAIEKGAEFSRSLLDIQVSARALRRSGLDTTIGEWTKFADDLNESFSQFGTVDINKGIAQLLDLGRTAKLSTEEIERLANAAAVLATKEGLSFFEAIDKLSQPIATGRTHALRDLVETMKETSMAQEAINRGLAESEDQVDAHVRALTALVIMEERAAQVSDDVGVILGHVAVQYESNKNKIETLTGVIGEKLLPLGVQLQKVWIKALTRISNFIEELQKQLITFNAHIVALLQPSRDFNEIYAEMAEIIRPDMFKEVEDAILGVSGSIDELSEGLSDKLLDSFNTIRELFISLKEDIAKIMRGFNDDVSDLWVDLGRNLEDINNDFLNDIEDDTAKHIFKLQQLYEKLQFDIAKVNRQYNDDIAEANEDYREEELKAEEDYQEKLRKLREQFLFDLEDALRERDARQIIRLIRQYNLRKTQLEREREIEKEQKKRDFEDELSDIKRRRDIRLRELQIEYAFRRRQMEAQFAFDQAMREKEHQRRLAEERKQAQERHEELKRELERRLEEEKIQAKERFSELLRQLQDDGTLTAKEAEAVAGIFDEVFGSDGVISGSMEELVSVLSAKADEAVLQLARIREAAQEVMSIATTAHDVEGTRGTLGQLQTVPTLNPSDDVLAGYLENLRVDEGQVQEEVKKITRVIDDELGEGGQTEQIYNYATDEAYQFSNTDLPKSLGDENGAILQSARGISESLKGIFGPDGEIESIMIYLVEMVQGAVESVVLAIQRLRNAIVSLYASMANISGGTTSPRFSAPVTPMADGGTLIAKKPTLALFGEDGPEMAQFTPLNRPVSNVSDVTGDGRASRQDRIELLVRYDQGLIAEIIDSTLDQTAEVILNVERVV